METILSYLDHLFESLPDSEEVVRAKAEKLAQMQKRYEALIREGKSDQEAAGMAISECGNIDDLKAKLAGKSQPEAGPRESRTEQRIDADSQRPIIIETRGRRRSRYYDGEGGNMFYTIYWCIVVVAYLAISYFTSSWGISWVIPVVAVVVFALITGGRRRNRS